MVPYDIESINTCFDTWSTLHCNTALSCQILQHMMKEKNQHAQCLLQELAPARTTQIHIFLTNVLIKYFYCIDTCCKRILTCELNGTCSTNTWHCWEDREHGDAATKWGLSFKTKVCKNLSNCRGNLVGQAAFCGIKW